MRIPPTCRPCPHALIGREQEIARIVAAQQGDGSPLITLTGPGGTGKTRLALGVAYELLELAAARIKVLSPKGLLDRLDHSLKLLSSGRRDSSERQRTLRGRSRGGQVA